MKVTFPNIMPLNTTQQNTIEWEIKIRLSIDKMKNKAYLEEILPTELGNKISLAFVEITYLYYFLCVVHNNKSCVFNSTIRSSN